MHARRRRQAAHLPPQPPQQPDQDFASDNGVLNPTLYLPTTFGPVSLGRV